MPYPMRHTLAAHVPHPNYWWLDTYRALFKGLLKQPQRFNSDWPVTSGPTVPRHYRKSPNRGAHSSASKKTIGAGCDEI